MAKEIVKLINLALARLSPRQKEVIKLRYGLQSSPLTLAAIGDQYDITRERVRQIEASALRLVSALTQSGAFNEFKQLVISHLRKFNGVRRHDQLSNDLKVSGNQLYFLLTSANICQHHLEDEDYYEFWHLSNGDLERARDFIAGVAASLKTGQKKNWLNDQLTANYISLSKKFTTSPYGDFGLADWREINPKVSRDWAYLVLKKRGQPLHFTQLAVAINKIRPSRRANPQTIHNELIKDKRFVLVGRGTYGLAEFGIIPGTAREVLGHFLRKHGPMPAKKLVDLVLQQRVFKDKTLYLNLQNKKHFQRLGDGRYSVKEV